MRARESTSYGSMFVMSLLTSWTFVTGVIGMLGWSDRHSAERLATWIGIWVFTVAVPTIQALQIHGALSTMHRDGCVLAPQSRRVLEQARVLILICGSMTVLLVFGLVVKR